MNYIAMHWYIVICIMLQNSKSKKYMHAYATNMMCILADMYHTELTHIKQCTIKRVKSNR